MSIDIDGSGGKNFTSAMLKYCMRDMKKEMFADCEPTETPDNLHLIKTIFTDPPPMEFNTIPEMTTAEAENILIGLQDNVYCYSDKNIKLICAAYDNNTYVASLAIKKDSEHVNKLRSHIDNKIVDLAGSEKGSDQIELSKLLYRVDHCFSMEENGGCAIHWALFRTAGDIFTVIKVEPLYESEFIEFEFSEDGDIVIPGEENPYINVIDMSLEAVFSKICDFSAKFRAMTVESIINNEAVISSFMKEYFAEKWVDRERKYISVVPKWMQALLFKEKFSDVKISCKDDAESPIYAHKLILANSSPYFEAILYGPMRSAANEHVTLDIPEFSKNSMESILAFMYTGDINPIAIDNIREFIMAADYFELKEIIEFVKSYFMM